MRLPILAFCLTVLNLTCVNSQPDDSADPNALVGADDVWTNNPNLMASNPQEASVNYAEPPQDPATIENEAIPNTDEINPTVAINPGDALALCGADGSQPNTRLRARDTAICPTRQEPSGGEIQQNPGVNGLYRVPGQIWKKIWGDETPATTEQEEEEAPPITKKPGTSNEKCDNPLFSFPLCCGGRMPPLVSFSGYTVLRYVKDCVNGKLLLARAFFLL